MPSYIGVIHRKEDRIYSVCLPDFAECVCAGRTLEEAYEMARSVLQEQLSLRRDRGETPPVPVSMRRVLADPAYSEAMAYIAIEAETPARVRRISVTMDEALLARIDAQTANRSGFLAEAARYYLRVTG
jgi:predicted RNase H-like HicB family nuclease